MPISNVPFWENRFAVNVARDKRVQAELAENGWSVLVIWECQIRSNDQLAAILEGFLSS
jgi:DNA mismatch endonuclease (patch repair protein)